VSGFDWQTPIVVAFVLGAALVVFRRAWKLFQAPRPGESACGSCGSCSASSPAAMTPADTAFVPLESLAKANEQRPKP
jgi:hypothetical protein